MPKDDEIIEVRCPECGAVVKIDREKAERDYKAKCPKGHDVQLVKGLG